VSMKDRKKIAFIICLWEDGREEATGEILQAWQDIDRRDSMRTVDSGSITEGLRPMEDRGVDSRKD
jgi:hypothetical protein